MLIDKDGNKVKGWDVQGLTSSEKDKILAFLQGAVYCWCNVHKCDSFQARNLIGGDNRNWHGTPLQRLYDIQHSADPYNQAAIEVGKLLKSVLADDKYRTFIVEGGSPLTYHWDGVNVD